MPRPSRFRLRLALACAALSLLLAVAGGWRLLRFLDGLRSRATAALMTLPLRLSQPVELPRPGRYLVSVRCPPHAPAPATLTYRLTSRLSGYEVRAQAISHRDHRLPGVIAYSHAALFDVPQSGLFVLTLSPLAGQPAPSACEIVIDQPSLQIRAIVEDTVLFTLAFLFAIALAVTAALLLTRARA